jgi:hypothetical protein
MVNVKKYVIQVCGTIRKAAEITRWLWGLRCKAQTISRTSQCLRHLKPQALRTDLNLLL